MARASSPRRPTGGAYAVLSGWSFTHTALAFLYVQGGENPNRRLSVFWPEMEFWDAGTAGNSKGNSLQIEANRRRGVIPSLWINPSLPFFFFSFGWIFNSDCLERTPRSCKNEEPEQRFSAFVHSRRGSLDFRLDKLLRLPMQTQKGHISSGRDDVLGPRVCSIIMSSNQILPQ